MDQPSPENLVLYVKTGCPWCIEAEEFLQANDIDYERHDVRVDHAAYKRMQSISNQTSAPTLEYQGEVLADFGVDELKPFLKDHHLLS